VTVRAVVSAHSTAATPDATPQPVLDWRFVALLA
jgi:hypothetical protein